MRVTVRAVEALRAASRQSGAAAAEQAQQGSAAAFLQSGGAAPPGGGPRGAPTTDLMLVAADSALAREGPGLVERFLLQPPDEGRDGHADRAHGSRPRGCKQCALAACPRPVPHAP